MNAPTPAPEPPVFNTLEAQEVVAFELFKIAEEESDDASASALWRETLATRARYRGIAKAMFGKLGEMGLKLSAGKQAAVAARILEIDTIPARKAYDLATDA